MNNDKIQEIRNKIQDNVKELNTLMRKYEEDYKALLNSLLDECGFNNDAIVQTVAPQRYKHIRIGVIRIEYTNYGLSTKPYSLNFYPITSYGNVSNCNSGVVLLRNLEDQFRVVEGLSLDKPEDLKKYIEKLN